MKFQNLLRYNLKSIAVISLFVLPLYLLLRMNYSASYLGCSENYSSIQVRTSDIVSDYRLNTHINEIAKNGYPEFKFKREGKALRSAKLSPLLVLRALSAAEYEESTGMVAPSGGLNASLEYYQVRGSLKINPDSEFALPGKFEFVLSAQNRDLLDNYIAVLARYLVSDRGLNRSDLHYLFNLKGVANNSTIFLLHHINAYELVKRYATTKKTRYLDSAVDFYYDSIRYFNAKELGVECSAYRQNILAALELKYQKLKSKKNKSKKDLGKLARFAKKIRKFKAPNICISALSKG